METSQADESLLCNFNFFKKTIKSDQSLANQLNVYDPNVWNKVLITSSITEIHFSYRS